MKRFKILIPTLVLVAAMGPLGCSSQQETPTTETATASQPAETNQSTTTTTTTNDSGHSTLLGATANFVWTVVAFPFRVVGDVLGEIV
jgi:hypothetical protein